LILNMVWLPPNIVNWISAYDFTLFMRNAHLGEELILYCPSKFLHPFWQSLPMGRSLEGLREMVFILKFGLCLSVYLSCISSLLDVLHGWICSVNSIKGLSWQYVQ
jgi:hypothetical protein